MSQYFNKKSFSSSFEDNIIPKLLYVCKAEGITTKMPRAMHMHEDLAEIVFIKSGSGLYTVEGKQYQTKKGDILIYNSKVLHDECVNPSEDMCVFCCGITTLKLKDLDYNRIIPEGYPAVISSGQHYTEIESLFEMLYTYTLDKSARAPEIANYILRTLLIIIINTITKDNQPLEPESKIIAMRIKNYIDTHYMEDINLYTMAEDLNMSLYYLSHIFKEIYGYAPKQYIIRRRIGEAQSLLINTNYGVTKIATMVGYNNSNHFNAIFVKMVGMSPGRYRKCWVN